MATDVERLVVSLEASIRGFERAMDKANGVTENTARKVERRFATMNKRMETSFASLSRSIGTAFAAAAATRGAVQLVDAATRIENSLKVVGLAGEELDKVYQRLYASAQRNMAPIETLTTLYSRLGLAQKELGVTNDELLNFTDKVALALRVQGTTAQEARGALIQLSQAMGSGIVRAEEFNSVVEGAPSILRATAAGLKEANGSVAQLRKLVIDGKLSSEAFFRAFEAGSVILEDQVAGAEVTVSQSFVRLQNVLIDVAGKMNEGTAASDILADGLGNLADGAENFGRWLATEGASIRSFFSDVSDAIAAAQRASQELGRTTGLSGFGRFVEDLTGLGVSSDYATGRVKKTADEIERLTGGATEADLAIAEAEQALATFALNSASEFGKLEPVVNDFIQQLLKGNGTAASAAEAIAAIGEVGEFGGLLSRLSGLVDGLFAVRIEAAAAGAAIAATQRGETSDTNIASQRAEQRSNKPRAVVAPVSLADYKPPAKIGGGGGSKQTPGEKFGDSVADFEQRLKALTAETNLLRTLNPLVNDYGYALEKARAAAELENSARKAGIEVGPQQKKQIEDLSTAYALATSNAARLAAAQDLAKQSADELAQAGRAALDTIVDGFLEGKDAGEIFNSVLKDLAKSLINMGLNSIGGGMKMGGFNPLGFLGGMFGFASGTANTGGVRGQPRGVVHGQEAVIPLPAGGKVPVDLRLPSMPAVGGVGGALTVHVVSDDEKFSAYVTDKAGAVVAQASPSIVGASVNQSNKSAPAAVARYQQQRGGSDYRTS